VRAAAQSIGIPVPRERLLRPGETLSGTHYPAFIKPNRGDGSVGITSESVVHNESEARICIQHLRAAMPGDTLVVQEFLAGDEYGVGIIGNPGQGFTILPVLEVDYSGLGPSLPRLLDYSSKTDPTSPYWTDIRFKRARLDDDVQQSIRDWCQALFARLGLRDYARFDFRADADGVIKLMEVNPNPAWCWDGKLAHMAEHMGESHSGLLRMIIEAARKRCFSSP
jgi:D-alanine-D-alanine ligase